MEKTSDISRDFKNPAVWFIYLLSGGLVVIYTAALVFSGFYLSLNDLGLFGFLFVGVSGGTLTGITGFIVPSMIIPELGG